MISPMKLSLLELFDILFSRKIICFGGEWGRGKTLSMVAYAYIASNLFGVKNIVSNIPVNMPFQYDYTPLVETSQFDTIPKDTIILHDELPNDLDSRNSMNPKNRFLMNFAKDLRKLHTQEVGTVQYFDFIDVRMNDLLQIIIIPTFVKKYHKNDREDILLRLKNKDFRSKWEIIDKKDEHDYSIILNLYPFINMYSTDFIPNSLASNHKEYIEYLMLSKSNKAYEAYMEMTKNNIILNKENLNDGLKNLVG